MFENLFNKVTNGGISSAGKLTSAEWNAFGAELISELTKRVLKIVLNGSDYTPTNGVIDLGAIETAVDSVLSTTSNNPVRNRVITAAIQALQSDISDIQEDMDAISEAAGSITNMQAQISALQDAVSTKFGHAVYQGGTIYFYDENGGTVLGSVTLSGTVYTIDIATNVDPIFSVLTGDTSKIITITPTTMAGELGEEPEPFSENYTYVVAIDTGEGYINRFNGSITAGGSASFDIRAYLAVGTNRIRISVTGAESGQTKTTILTATLTSLMLSCSHSWYTPWYDGEDYTVNNIYFSGAIQKTLHVKIGETELTRTYRANENYSTVATNFVIAAEYFPADLSSGVHTIELWMTGEGVSTQHISFNIMCVLEGDTTPLVCINDVATAAVNYSQATLFQFAAINADSVVVAGSVSADGSTYVFPSQTLAVETGTIYTYSTALEVETEAESGTLTASITPYNGETEGEADYVTMPLDNSLAFLAASNPVFYMNSALRANTEADRDVWKNNIAEPASGMDEFAGIWEGFTWSTDGWATDPDGNKAFFVPAGCSGTIPTLAPFDFMGQQGVSIEMVIRSSNIADHDTPILQFVTMNSSNNKEGFILYPTQVLVLGTSERSEVLQSCGICEDSIVHIMLTLTKNYSGINGRNLATLYINGIPNVSFSFGSVSQFGTGGLSIGQEKTDFYLYSMRIYDRPLEGSQAKDNFLNAIIESAAFNRAAIREKDAITDGNVIEYDLCKRLGYNIMVIQPDNDAQDIPAFNNQATITSTVRFEYWSQPSWNVTLEHVPVDGQGTTSKKYFRWNLRGKLGDDCVWTYADGTTTTGKKGYMDGGPSGAAGHLKIDRFTAKKNIASSQQGHKMGACGLYDDVFAQMGLKEHMPDDDFRVAVWQRPFIGFRRYSNGTYEFIGLYTAGPDKGCKTSFGYDKSTYPACMCIEGPNHYPRGTKFLQPWVDVDYSTSDETLTFGGQEAWDCDFCRYSTDDATKKADILALYVSEWKPAYDLVYHTSLYIASLQEAFADNYDVLELTQGGTYSDADIVTAINSHLAAFLNGTTNGRKNSLMSFYDSSYDIWYQSIVDEEPSVYVKLVREDGDASDGLWNIKTYLGLTGSPTTADILAARKAKFRSDVEDYFDMGFVLAHKAFCLLIGAKDNDAKNSYPFKHLALASGGRWMLKQDDLDSILKTDNNGQGTVGYSVEPGDLSGGVQIFQGCDSALWTMIWEEYQSELRTTMTSMCTAIAQIASRLGISGQYLHESVFNVLSYYFFEHSAKYFPITAYQEDRVFGYIDPWLADPTQAYNGVYPLTQALGDRHEEEKLWIERRIAYIFSKYRVGAMTGQNAGWGEMSFTLQTSSVFSVTPAIDFYPVANLGGGSDSQAVRTREGDTSYLTVTSSGDTTVYIKGVDWISSLGDLSGIVLASRGGSDEKNFSVVSKRMQTLKVGDAVAANVSFNATSLTVSGPSFEIVDARNVTTIANAVDLSGCPRLRKALFEGCTNCTGLTLPVGSRVNEVSFPDTVTTLFLHTLSALTMENLTIPSAARRTVTGIYFNRCAQLNPITIFGEIASTANNSLGFVTLIWDGTMNATGEAVAGLVQMASANYGCVDYIDGVISNNPNSGPIVRGTIYVDNISETDYDTIVEAFPELTVTYGQKTLAFEDRRVWEICSYNWGYTYDLQEVNGQGGVLDTGELEGNGDTMAYCDHIFACSTAIGAHGTVPATSARTVQYRLELVVEGGRALDGTQAPWDGSSATGTNSVFYPVQYSSAMAATALGNITSENWNAGASFWGTQTILVDDGMVSATARKYHAIITTTNAAQYLRLGIRAVAGTTISYKFVSIGVTKVPSGITSEQCAAVTSLSTKFMQNTQIRYFDELKYFTSVKICYNGATASNRNAVFSNCTNLEKLNTINITRIEGGSGISGANSPTFYGTKIKTLDLPNLTTIGSYAFRGLSSAKIMIGTKFTTINSAYALSYCSGASILISATTPATGNTMNRNSVSNSYIYVPDDYVDTYKAASAFSTWASYIRKMSDYTD